MVPRATILQLLEYHTTRRPVTWQIARVFPNLPNPTICPGAALKTGEGRFRIGHIFSLYLFPLPVR